MKKTLQMLRMGALLLMGCLGWYTARASSPPADTTELVALLHAIDSLASEGQCQALGPMIAQAQAWGRELGDPWRTRALASGRMHSKCLRGAGEYRRALTLARQHAALLERELPGSEALMDAWNELGIILFRLSRYDEARAVYERGLALARQLFGDESIEVARFSNNIGLTLGDERAIPYYEQAVRILRHRGDTASMEAVIFNFNLATTWYNAGELRKAVDGFRSTLRLLEALPDASPGNIALVKNNLSVALQNLGERDEAMRLLLETRDLYESAFGPDHPQTAYGYSNLGLFFYDEGDYGRALNYFFKALAIRRAKMGEQHELVGNLYNNIGNCYRGLKRYQDALDYCEKALAIRLAVLGPDHREVADSYGDLGAIYQEMGLYERALA
ncbi:MAG: tetratricopeptide repeat protein, partial [Bacteroidetes bacterium]